MKKIFGLGTATSLLALGLSPMNRACAPNKEIKITTATMCIVLDLLMTKEDKTFQLLLYKRTTYVFI